MKFFFQTLLGSIATGFASYYIILECFNTLLWFFDYELTTSQRIFVIENGYLAFVAGMVVFWRVFRKVG